MKVTGVDPKSRLGTTLLVGVLVVAGGELAEGVGFAAALFELSAGTNSVTVTSLPSAYFVVTVFAIMPSGTARLGGGRGGMLAATSGGVVADGGSSLTATAATTGILSLSGGADGAASSFSMIVGGILSLPINHCYGYWLK